MLRIRREVFRVSQAEMARLIGTTQATVSRWEKGLSEPPRDALERVREAAARLGLLWNDAWFFALPPAATTEALPAVKERPAA
ncbi:helix-turn-helix domain-containing protein [Methylobacterium isbiliense]|nr:helix-turn-helix transcriptional regulator [Methylobacterium isbiliense]MDN3622571.1 helix-turn-helix transcriptional regulator [Methylobacterium isbiliense]